MSTTTSGAAAASASATASVEAVEAGAEAPQVRHASASWNAGRRRAFAKFRLFQRAKHAELLALGATATWHNLPQSVLRDRRVYEMFQDFLLFEYVIPEKTKGSGERLDVSTVNSTISIMLNAVKNMYETTGEPETREFILCLDPTSSCASASWWRKVRDGSIKVCFQRAMASGEDMDKSAKEVHVCSLSPDPYPFNPRFD